MSQTALHLLDRTTFLRQNSDGSLMRRRGPAYAHTVGPFGGITVVNLLYAVFSRSARVGHPLSLIANYGRPIADGEYPHANTEMLAARGKRPLVGLARASHFGLGYHPQSAEIRSNNGALVATCHQIVYFKGMSS